MAKKELGQQKNTAKKRMSVGQKNRKNEGRSVQGLGSFLSNPWVVFILSLLVLFLTIYIFVAMASYLFTCSEDQSALYANKNILEWVPVENITGSYGAYIADWLVSHFLGLGSFLLLFIPFLWSIQRLGIKKNISKSFLSIVSFSVFGSLWISCFFAYVYSIFSLDFSFPLGGDQGDFIQNVLLKYVGHIGLILILIIVLTLLLILISPSFLDKFQEFLTFSWLSNYFKNLREKKQLLKEELQEVETEETENYTFENNDLEEPELKEEKEYSLGEDLKEAEAYIEGNNKEEFLPQDEDDPAPIVEDMVIEKAPEEESIGVDEQQKIKQSNDATLLEEYIFPSIDLLNVYDQHSNQPDFKEVEEIKMKIIQTLSDFGIKATPCRATIGPTVTLYEIQPSAGTAINRIKNRSDDLALSLKADGGVRIIAPVPGKGTVGIEVPNSKPQIVSFHSLVTSRKFAETKMELPIAIGKTITNEIFMFDLAKMPHMLIAGATGQGKSVGLNVMISSLLYTKHPSELKFVMIDPKMLEFSIYEDLESHYLAKLPKEKSCIITDMSKVVETLNSLCIEMDNRYTLLADSKVKNIVEYNEKIKKNEILDSNAEMLPYIVLVIDEFADLIMTSGREVETPITRLAQKARAAGIHMILATQRPTTNIITGTIKANFPARIAFKVFSSMDSRTILDGAGANLLVGRGDMLFYQGKDMLRIQCALIDTPETERIVDSISEQQGFEEPYSLPEVPMEEVDSSKGGISLDKRDILFEDVARMVVETQQGSTSKIQRQYEIGFNRAGRIMDQLEAAGIVAPQRGSKSREVLIQDISTLENLLDSL